MEFMKQSQQAKFHNESNKIQLLCDTDTALGDLHDFLMALKGEIVSRMLKAQQDEMDAQESCKANDVEEVNAE